MKLHEQWSRARGRYRGMSDPAHPFRHQGSADLNTYKMFVEAGHAVLRNGGQLGLVVPSGLYTDKGTGDLRRLLLQGCRWRWLYGFENRDRIFDIHRSFKFCVTVAEKGGETAAIRAAFMRHDLEDWADAVATLDYPAERVSAFSPKSLSVLEIRSEKDLEVLTKLYSNGVLLGDDTPAGWGIKYGTEFHMTNDSKLFIGRDKAEASGFEPDAYGRWVNAAGEVLLPLYEGRMVGQFDFSEKGWVSGKGRTAVWREIPWSDKKIEPQYLMPAATYAAERSESCTRPRVAFMDITSATNQRTCIASALPGLPCGNSAPVLYSISPLALAAVLNSFAYDSVARQRCGGLHLNYFVIEETPLSSPQTSVTLLEPLSARLHAGHHAMASLIASAPRSCRAALTAAERVRARCMVDAIVASNYGLSRDDFAWMLRDCDHPASRLSDKAFGRTLDPKGFWRIAKDKDPELRHTVLSLAAFDDLQRAIAASGSHDTGIETWCSQNDGDGWMLPETLCVADLGLTRTVALDYDERAKTPQPVRSRMGERFLDWQLAQTPEESWAECERHAKALGEAAVVASWPAAADSPKAKPAKPRAKPTTQASLPGFEN